MPHVRRKQRKPTLDITAVSIPFQEATDGEAVPKVVQPRTGLAWDSIAKFRRYKKWDELW